MKIAIRVDASLEVGTGHVMRCLTLAERMTGRGAMVAFVCREDAGHLCDQIEHAHFAVGRLPPLPGRGIASDGSWRFDAEHSLRELKRLQFLPDLLVVDQYALEERWERALRPVAPRILVIDDLANRPHDCDVLLDPNLHDSPASRYKGLVGENTQVFVGPQFALLRAEFDRVPVRTRDQGLHGVFAFFGGSDPSNEAFKLVHALRALAARAPQTVMVLGPINPRTKEIRRAAVGLDGLVLIGQTNEMARLMADSDLALGTCGGAAWERCAIGLPALVVVSAQNQRDDARILHSLGAVRSLGEADKSTAETWVAAISAIQDDRDALAAMSRAAQTVMQGRHQAMRELESALVQ